MMKKGVIFDLDGTLWNTSMQVVPAWNTVLKRHGEVNKQITIDDMQGFMGKTIDVIAGIMLPYIEVNTGIEILKECCKEEQVYLRKNGGSLYPKLEDTLKLLSQKYNLYIVSNCQDGYVQAFLDYHKLWSYFDDIEMSGRTGKNKGENIKDIIQRNKLDKCVYVGDTMGDFEAANYAGIPFIHARYGFGKVDNAKIFIDNIWEINNIIDDVIL